MMRPYYRYDDDRQHSAGPQFAFGAPLTPAIRWIIGVNIAVFILMHAVGPGVRTAVFEFFAFDPRRAIGSLWIWQAFTYMFLHASFGHIFFNLFFLWMIGGLAEQSLGTRRFLWLYIISGVAGAIAQAAVAYGSITVGASGAIMGVAAAVAALHPDMRLLIFFILPMKMRHFIWLLVLLQVWGLSNAARADRTDNIAYFAHLAGLVAGYLFIRWHRQAGWWLSRRYYAARGRFRGIRPSPQSTRIDDDDKYRQEVDRLLDKIFREGTQSLTREENEFLKKQSEKFKK